MLGNFQHNPDRIPRVLESTNSLTNYFQQRDRAAMRNIRAKV